MICVIFLIGMIHCLNYDLCDFLDYYELDVNSYKIIAIKKIKKIIVQTILKSQFRQLTAAFSSKYESPKAAPTKPSLD
jgi:hypothetical protein